MVLHFQAVLKCCYNEMNITRCHSHRKGNWNQILCVAVSHYSAANFLVLFSGRSRDVAMETNFCVKIGEIGLAAYSLLLVALAFGNGMECHNYDF